MFNIIITPARGNTKNESLFTIKNITSILEQKGFQIAESSASLITKDDGCTIKGIKATIMNKQQSQQDGAAAANSSSASSSALFSSIPRLIDLADDKQPQPQQQQNHSPQEVARIFVDPTQLHKEKQELLKKRVSREARVFVVGAGGIGCELLKDLYLAGWRNIQVIDLDTIDATNLNRQFLFRPEDVGKSKSAVASERILSWSKSFADEQKDNADNNSNNPLKIISHHGNVKDSKFNADFYKNNFDVVINGLDNVSARKHVNRVCIEAGVPLVESGTMGYNGQAQPIVRGRYSCYDCQPKQAEQKTFAVCTIHSKPTTIVHCVHYAKELYARLFGDAVGGASEFDFLNEKLASAAASSSGNDNNKKALNFEFARLLGEAIFDEKIKGMIAMKKEATTAATAATTTTSASEPIPIPVTEIMNKNKANGSLDKDIDGENEKDPQIPRLINLFAKSIEQCRNRDDDRVPFDKNDDIAVNFVASIANLRAHVFHIARKSSFEIRTIAGNIVPAIASTNAAVAASAVHLATQLLLMTKSSSSEEEQQQPEVDALMTVMRSFPAKRKRILLPPSEKFKGEKSALTKSWEYVSISAFTSGKPNPNCIVCRESRQSVLQVRLHAGNHTLGQFVNDFLMKEMSLVSPIVNHNENTIYEHEEYESLSNNPMTQYCCGGGSSNNRCEFDVEDFEQNVEWKVQVVHDEKVPDEIGDEGRSPFIHTVLSVGAAAEAAAKVTDEDAAATANNNNDKEDDQKLLSRVTGGARAIDDDELVIFNPSKKYVANANQKNDNNQNDNTNNRPREEDEKTSHSATSKRPRNEAADTIELE